MTIRGPDIQAVRALGVRRMTVDSRAVRPGDTFVAYPGESRDGRDYIAQAVRNGACSVLWSCRRHRQRDLRQTQCAVVDHRHHRH